MLTMNTITYEKRGHIGLLTINRPKAMNAFNNEVVTEVYVCLESLVNTDIRCLIVTGSGEKAFVAGADIREMQYLNPSQAAAFSRAGNAVMALLEDFPVPIIAAINGYAMGGGCELALSCDIRIASENAVFSFPEVGLGIIPGFGGAQRLARIIGIGKAKELIYTTNRINAADALTVGLVNAVYPQEQLLDKCLEMAEKIASNAPTAVRVAKGVINKSMGMELHQSYGLEVLPFSTCFLTSDRQMAMDAFVDKRPKDAFTGK
ncbi:3-hydroxybutyryl-CoA dehydratase [uncultured delta proteobacterium]|uniref:3-hydroxybutyryl-CoA dehydratase n=1 Tax=uncultured delta proteobacterium TaxID=34034 RepID=A0A212JUA2_9DELT|nr:3-hydroxybutyryl-CoA dehydratase [uncultured delta proteobacterium]